MTERVKRLASDAAVKKATGKTWQQWFKLIDGAKDLDKTNHKEVAGWLYTKHIKSGWWSQCITVGYEYERGLRTVGETKDVGFEIGVQKTFLLSAAKAWQLITSPKGVKLWLGDPPAGGQKLTLKPKAKYQTRDGTTGEIRSLKKPERLRFTWQPNGRSQPTTAQISLIPAKDKTAIHFHHEKLADTKERDKMRKHWNQVLNKLQTLVK